LAATSDNPIAGPFSEAITPTASIHHSSVIYRLGDQDSHHPKTEMVGIRFMYAADQQATSLPCPTLLNLQYVKDQPRRFKQRENAFSGDRDRLGRRLWRLAKASPPSVHLSIACPPQRPRNGG